MSHYIDSELVCTCGDFDAAFYHDSDCELWQDPDFQAGIFFWTGTQLAPVPVDANPDDYATQRDWEVVRKMNDEWEQGHKDPLDELFDEWEEVNDDIVGKALSLPTGTTTIKSKVTAYDDGWTGHSYGGASTYHKCRHYGVTVTLPDGTPIMCSSEHVRKPDEETPDFGCYMACSWHPKWISFHLEWTDFGLPQIPADQMIWTLDYLLEYARSGRKVEIGCIGGHGRTGSMLALLAMRSSGLSAHDAAWFVWENYCTEAIEGKKQLWYLEAFDEVLHGRPMPEPPQEPCYEYEHKKLWEKGETCQRAICHTHGTDSTGKIAAWAEDFATFMRPKKVRVWVKGVEGPETLEYPKIHANWL